MAEPHVVSALTAKRAELAGEIELTARHLQQLKIQLQALDRTLALFDPSILPDAIEPKVWRPRADWAGHGEMSRAVLDILRLGNGQPISTRDLAIVYMSDRGMDVNDARMVRLMSKRIGTCLRGKRDQQLVASEPGPGQVHMWRLA
jgi:hypothetical protein